MATAKVFQSGNSQAVRLPKSFRLNGPEVEIFRRGDEIVLREKGRGLGRASCSIQKSASSFAANASLRSFTASNNSSPGRP
jgi:virulence-associated protein VagC